MNRAGNYLVGLPGHERLNISGNVMWEPQIHKGLGWEASGVKQEEEIAV